LFCPPQDRAVLVAHAEKLGYRTVVLPSDAPIAVAVVSADDRGADDVVRSFAVSARVVVYGRSIDDIAEIRFRSLGAGAVVDADRFLDEPGEYLPALA
jgi:hypothetical protein